MLPPPIFPSVASPTTIPPSSAGPFENLESPVTFIPLGLVLEPTVKPKLGLKLLVATPNSPSLY